VVAYKLVGKQLENNGIKDLIQELDEPKNVVFKIYHNNDITNYGYSNTISFYNEAIKVKYYDDIFFTGTNDEGNSIIVLKNYNQLIDKAMYIATSPANLSSTVYNQLSVYGEYRAFPYSYNK
jgi:hypothetical protein